MRGRRLLVVEETFAIEGRGLVLTPEVDLRGRDPQALVVSLRRPDRTVIRALAFAEVLLAQGRSRHVLRIQCSKDEVPLKSEIWLLDPVADAGGARGEWQRGEWLRCGILLARSLRDHERPAWAAGVLEAACRFIDAPEPVRAVLEIARRPTRWKEAHDAFRAVRELTLRTDESLLHLAENTAKVSYNASCEPAPFDEDAGAWLPQNANAFITGVPAAREAIEAALFRRS